MIRKLLFVVFVSLFLSLAAFAQGTGSTTATKETKSSTKAPVFRPTKDQIRQGQEMLITEKLYSGKATGVYGDSRPAIKAYQKANGLEENGKFDRATLEKMGIELTDSQKGIASAPAKTTSEAKAAKTSTGPKRPAPFRATADQIKAVQKLLKEGKMYSGEETGKFSDEFRDGLGKYQEANDIKVTKTLNAATLEKMGIELTDKQKEQVAAQAAYDAAKDN